MSLSNQALAELKEIIQDEFGVILSEDEYRETGFHFLQFFAEIFQPIPDEKEQNE